MKQIAKKRVWNVAPILGTGIVHLITSVPSSLFIYFVSFRCFLVTNCEGNFLHARIHPEMVLITSTITEKKITLTAPGVDPFVLEMDQFLDKIEDRTVKYECYLYISIFIWYSFHSYSRVWGQTVQAVDCGDEVAKWFSEYIFHKDSGARLVYYPHTTIARKVKTTPVFPQMLKTDGVR